MQLNVKIDVHHHLEFVGPSLESLLTQLGASIVSQLSDKIAAANAAADAAISRVQADLTGLRAKIAELQAQVDAGGATPEILQALDNLKAKYDALDVTNPATLPDAGTTPDGG